MCCFLTTLVLIGPRAAIVLWWIAQPLRWQTTFTSFMWPLLGLIFLPWVTLMYVLVAPGGVVGFDWLWLVLALMVDLGSYGGGAYSRRGRVA